ncbi:MAG: hypothetical protein ABL970_06650 [Nitrospira sp.]
MDSGPIPLVGEHRTKSQPIIRFYYCRFCEQLFAFTTCDDTGEGLVASFGRSTTGGRWEIRTSSGPEMLVRIAQTATRTLQPNSDGTL